jgi:hypothetical protein
MLPRALAVASEAPPIGGHAPCHRIARLKGPGPSQLPPWRNCLAACDDGARHKDEGPKEGQPPLHPKRTSDTQLSVGRPGQPRGQTLGSGQLVVAKHHAGASGCLWLNFRPPAIGDGGLKSRPSGGSQAAHLHVYTLIGAYGASNPVQNRTSLRTTDDPAPSSGAFLMPHRFLWWTPTMPQCIMTTASMPPKLWESREESCNLCLFPLLVRAPASYA